MILPPSTPRWVTVLALEEEFGEQGSVDKWRFNPDQTKIDERLVNAHNRGGEFHTFTPVDHFGGGFVEFLNAGQDPIVECARRDAQGAMIPAATALATLVPPDADSAPAHVNKGVHKFQCCIHPWMRTTIQVK